jgi:hypothetical protein
MEVTEPRYEPYRETAGAPFRWRLGLRPLDLADWIQIDDQYDHDLAEKQRVLSEHRTTVFRVLDDVVDESQEVLDAIVAHLRTHERFVALEPDRDLHPLDAAGRLVQEDLVLLVERDGELVCGGGSVCFPNRWDLASKVGQPMTVIHAPVARLNEQLAAPIDRFLDRLTPERSYWRLGWGVLDTDELFQPTDGSASARPAAAPPGVHHLRVERETLRRFPATSCVLFTIRTYLTPLAGVVPHGDAAALAAAIEALPSDVAAYKQLDGVGDELTAWLRELAG